MDTNQVGIVLNRTLGQYIAISLIVSAPFTILIAQAALAIREMALNSRKTYSTDDPDYDLTKWIGTGLVYVAIFSFIFGVGLFLRFL